ncbi:MAG: hypothetical protein K5846_09040 [Bacteroidales bacterium]|nr:hypothetical protein [Bacteroidales bacterium]
MKKHLTLLLTCLLMAGATFAQHLSFKGVPIDGTLQEYTNAMVKAGFHYEDTQDGVSILSGDFAGYKNCHIGVSTLKNCNTVSHIAVLFPDRDTWTSLHGDYEYLKEMLTEKYGAPEESKEKFTGYVGDYDNSLIMHALREDKYIWYSTFSTKLGKIKLTLSEGEKSYTGRVVLIYQDGANSEKVRAAAMEDL